MAPAPKTIQPMRTLKRSEPWQPKLPSSHEYSPSLSTRYGRRALLGSRSSDPWLEAEVFGHQTSFIACRRISLSNLGRTPPNSDRVILKSPTCRSPHYTTLGHATQELNVFLRGFSSPLQFSPTSFPSPPSSASTSPFADSVVPPEVIFLVCYYLPPQQLTLLARANRLLNLLVNRHPIWKEIVIKQFGFKYENYKVPGVNKACNWKLVYDKICCFRRTLTSGRPPIYVFPYLFSSACPIGVPQSPGILPGPMATDAAVNASVDEVSICLSTDMSDLVWQKGTIVVAIKFNSAYNPRIKTNEIRATKVWELDLFSTLRISDESVSTSSTCLVTADDKLFIFVAQRLFAISMKTGSVLRELIGSMRTGSGGWDVAVDPTLDVSLRNHKLAVLCNDVISIWDVNTLREVFTLECPDLERAVIRARFIHLDALYRQRYASITSSRHSLEDLTPVRRIGGPIDMGFHNFHSPLGVDLSLDAPDADSTLCPVTDFSWIGYICSCGPTGGECLECASGHAQSLTCTRRSRSLAMWFRDRSPRLWIHDAESGDLQRVVCAADPAHTAEWQEYVRSANKAAFKFSKSFLSTPCIRRVKHTANMSDPFHVFLVTLDTRGTIRLFDSSREYAQIAVLHTGDNDVWRIMLASNLMFTMSIQAELSDGRVDPPNVLRFWRFHQPSVTEDLVVPLEEVVEEPLTCRENLGSCSSAQDRSEWKQLFRQKPFDHAFKSTPTHLPPLSRLISPHLTPCARDLTPLPTLKILSPLGGCTVPSSVYLCDVVDRSFLAFWHSIPSARGLFEEETDSLYAVSNWRVHQMPESLLDPNSPEPLNRSALLGKRVYGLNNRADAWSLLDWRSVCVMDNGTLIMYDLCPIADKKDTVIPSCPCIC